ncbi:MAG: hypothetical protein FJW78_02295 [Actinobacteria bacterium]|nr:hypothetical protein [Actinomycetota bacterium]
MTGATGVAGADGGVMIGFDVTGLSPLLPPFPPELPLPRPGIWVSDARSSTDAPWGLPGAPGAAMAAPDAATSIAPDAAAAMEMRKERLLTGRL